MAELKSCPFCGRTPTVDDCGEHRYFVRCKCGIAQDKLYMQKCDAVRRWNTRKTTLADAQPTLYGYDIKHLDLIARVLQKENLPPERITEALTDIGHIVSIVRNEFEETLRRSVEQVGGEQNG